MIFLELTWVKVSGMNANIPPHAVLGLRDFQCFQGRNMYVGRTIANGEYIPVEIYDNYLNFYAYYYSNNKEVQTFDYEVIVKV